MKLYQQLVLKILSCVISAATSVISETATFIGKMKISPTANLNPTHTTWFTAQRPPPSVHVLLLKLYNM